MKSPQAFRSIGEVARLVGVATHVLRYWETQFPALAPVRRPDGRRYYRPDDLLLAAGLCEVMREDGLTIRGAQRLIAQDKGAGLRERGRLRLEAAAERKAAEATGRKAAPRARRAATRPEDPPAHGQHAAQPAAASPRAGTAQGAQAGGNGPAAAAPDGRVTNGADWLDRLTATAAALRQREHPLPADAAPLHQALRRLQHDRD